MKCGWNSCPSSKKGEATTNTTSIIIITTTSTTTSITTIITITNVMAKRSHEPVQSVLRCPGHQGLMLLVLNTKPEHKLITLLPKP